ncbi:related to carbonic anhydrase precursor [Phialocephala subalpina]|uniref:Related to carbonic anhydrase n=1 Tax=Phialocephala subalpina TaxID=576137 RepID=A0A1L7WMR8_9HELO|nr:related to carbonic anhydrase precursor [Phialocephala subalpina]
MYSLLLNFAVLPAFIKTITACPQHDFHGHSLNKRAGGTQDWTYEASYNWGMVNSNYTTCQTGTTQSPIQLLLTQGLSQAHLPSFSTSTYSSVPGTLSNWGYGPAFSVSSSSSTHPSSNTTSDSSSSSAPSFTYLDANNQNTTLYLKGWHIHAPADHSVQGDRAKAELHLVHTDSSGAEAGVIAIRIDPGNADSPFFSQILPSTSSSSNTTSLPGFDSQETIPMDMDVYQALREVNLFSDFWTYMGSLTSPPCTEGIRWWVARNTLFVGNRQMREILGVSTFSARVEQEVWLHGINV